jgi:hypothetical protein
VRFEGVTVILEGVVSELFVVKFLTESLEGPFEPPYGLLRAAVSERVDRLVEPDDHLLDYVTRTALLLSLSWITLNLRNSAAFLNDVSAFMYRFDDIRIAPVLFENAHK